MRPDHKRDKIITIRWAEVELKELDELRGAKSRARYIRAKALSRGSNPLPAYEELRDLRNDVIRSASLLKTDPRAMKALIRALDRISRF